MTKFFSSERSRWFIHHYSRDYRDTYYAPEVHGGVFLKHYRLDAAPARIRRRNVIRRALSRKGMCLHYPLRDKGVASVQPLLCAWRGGWPVAAEAVLICRAEPSHHTLDQVMESSLGLAQKTALAAAAGRFMAMLRRRRVCHGELPSNLLAIPDGESWRLVLCDLDEVRSLNGHSPDRTQRVLEDMLRTLRRRAPATVEAFLEAYDAG